MAERGPRGTAKRPRDRKAQIAEAAAALFREQGYHRVGIEDIATSVGITGRAIYRHFGNKHDLLASVVLEGIARLEATVDAYPDGPLSDLVAAMATVTMEARDLGVLVQRESRHLTDHERADVRRRTDTVVATMAALVRHDRPELADGDAQLLARAALAVLASPSYHAVVMPKTSGESLLTAMARAATTSRALPRPAGTAIAAVDFDDSAIAGRASRREEVLAAAIELFARHGYAAVRMEDVGAAAGITGPSVYQHFAGKTDLLMAALHRGAEWLQLGLSRAFAAGGDAPASLELVLRSYVEFMLQHTDLMSVLLTETIYLPDEERHAIRRVQYEYVAEWVRLLLAARPGLTSAEGRFLVQGVLGLVNDNVHGDARTRPDLDEILVLIGLDVLGVSS